MSHPIEGRLNRDPRGLEAPHVPAPPGDWLEARIRAVFVAVLVTWVLIAVWKVIRQLP